MLLNDAALGNKTLFLTTSSDLISTHHLIIWLKIPRLLHIAAKLT